MAKTATASAELSKGAKVVASTALRDVPEGTPGKVIMVSGVSWIRYWVLFENGVRLGSINRAKLATPDEWERHLSGDAVADEVADSGESNAAAADESESASTSGKATPSGTMVPQLLLDRSAAARVRLGG